MEEMKKGFRRYKIELYTSVFWELQEQFYWGINKSDLKNQLMELWILWKMRSILVFVKKHQEFRKLNSRFYNYKRKSKNTLAKE